MHSYLELLKKILETGEDREDRTGVGTRSLFAQQLHFNLKTGFPLQTTKKIHWKSVVHELLWFLRGDTNLNYLHQHQVTIWDEWADEQGNLGPIYGHQWRSWTMSNGEKFDQIKNVVNEIQNNPSSRRLLVSAWNVGDISSMRLPPCHVLFQFYVGKKGLSCQLYQRSADLFLGVPFNIASYALLTHLIAWNCCLEVDQLTITFGDVHLYSNHYHQTKTLLEREPLPPPKLILNPNQYGKSIDDITSEDINLSNYQYHSAIPAPIAV